MRSIATIVACLLLGTATVAAALPTTSDRVDFDAIPEKNAQPSVNQHYDGNFVGGEDIPNAVLIPALPYSDDGNTCGFADDYDEVCPYPGSLSGDVVYKFSPVSNITIDINLCSSGYDTKVYVYETDATTVVGCNDDAGAGCGPDGFRSFLNVTLTGGNDYYIVVDGWNSACGDYVMCVTQGVPPPPCAFCPPGAQIEGEPACMEACVDVYNGGCNSVPFVFSPVECNTICGTTFYCANGTLRDTDWYQFTLVPGTYTYSGISNGFPLHLIVAGNNCPNPTIYANIGSESCVQSAEITFTVPGQVPAGPINLFASTLAPVPCASGEKPYTLYFNGPGVPSCGPAPLAMGFPSCAVTGACCLQDGTCEVTSEGDCVDRGGEYVGNGTACGPTTCESVSVEPATWGKIKSIYK